MKKFDGIPGVQATSNIPIFRKSEMALIVAECEARNGNLDEAKNYLMFTAKRNKTITSVEDLPAAKDEFISIVRPIRRFYINKVFERGGFQFWDILFFIFSFPLMLQLEYICYLCPQNVEQIHI